MFFQNFCILVIAIYSSLSVDVSRSFLTYLIDTTTCQHWNIRQCHFLSIGLDNLSAFYSITLMSFNGESPAAGCRDQLPSSGNILHHFSFLVGRRRWGQGLVLLISPDGPARDWLGWGWSLIFDSRLCNTPFQACGCPNVSFKGLLVASRQDIKTSSQNILLPHLRSELAASLN